MSMLLGSSIRSVQSVNDTEKRNVKKNTDEAFRESGIVDLIYFCLR